MPEYAYKAIGRDGVEIMGQEQAESLEALTLVLRKKQLSLLHAKTKKSRAIGLSVTLPFISELSPLVNSGIPLERALQIVAEDSREARVPELAEQLRKTLKRGESFSEALTQAGRFDSLFIALVKVGEASGELPKVLGILENHYQEARKIRGELIASLTYPAILAIVSIASVIGLALFVVPVFKDIFADSPEIVLPLGTRILFALSDFALRYGWVVLAGLIVAATGVTLLVQRNAAVKRAWHALQLRLPLTGDLQAKFAAFKLAKALSIMLTGGLPLARAVEISRPLLTNLIQREGLESCLTGLRKGEPIPQAVNRIPALPVQFHRYIKLGNETGNLGPNLGRVADVLQEDFRNRLKSLVSVLDPLIIVTMGGVVGFMVISILVAVFSLSDVH
jgi:general secretion pathway protein F